MARPSPRPERLPYRKKWYLLSQAELCFYEVLREAAGADLQVFPKVRLLDLLWLPDNLSNRQSYMNRVMSKHVDFVFCHRHIVAPMLVIELDDASHGAGGRMARDGFVNAVLQTAELPILRVPVKSSYNPQELADQIQKALWKADKNTPGPTT